MGRGRKTPSLAPPWSTCEAALSEAFHLLGTRGAPALRALLRRRSLLVAFDLEQQMEPVLKLMQKYADVPMSLADACQQSLLQHSSRTVPNSAPPSWRRRAGRLTVLPQAF